MTRPSGTVGLVKRIAAAFLALAILWTPAAAGAQTLDCDAVVADVTGNVGDLAAVEAASATLAAQGAVVRVRVLRTSGHDLLGYVEDEVRRCESWQGSDGERGPNLLALVVALEDRQTGVYFGDNLLRLDRHEHSIQVNTINPHFRNGNFTAGLVAGLEELGALALQPERPSDTRPRGTVPSAGQSAKPPKSLNLAPFLIGFAVLLLAGGIAVGGTAVVRSRRKLAEHRAGTEARRSKIASDAFALYIRWEEVKDRLPLTIERLVDGERTKVKASVATLTGEVESAIAAITDLPDQSAISSADHPTLTGYEKRLTGVVDLITSANSAVDQLIATCDELDGIIDGIEDDLGVLSGSADEVAVTLGSLTEAGFNTTELNSRHAKALADIDKIQVAYNDSRFLAARDLRDVVTGNLADLGADLARVTQVHAEVVAVDTTSAVSTITEQVRSARNTAKGLLRKWDAAAVGDYAEAAAEAETAGKELRAAAKVLDGFKVPAKFDLAPARAALTEYTAVLDRFTGHCATVTGAEAHLQSQLAEAERRVTEAKRALRAAESSAYTRGTGSARSAIDRYSTLDRGGLVNPVAILAVANRALEEARDAQRATEAAQRAAEEEARRRREAEERRRREAEERRRREARAAEERRRSSSSSGGSSTNWGGGSRSSGGGGRGGGSSSNW